MIEMLPYYLLLGCVAGTLAGMLGIGGGLIIVPALAFTFEAQGFDESIIMHLALGSSLATIVVTSLASIRTHHRHGAVMWPLVMRLSGGIVVGAVLGALLADQLASGWLQKIFAIFTLLVAVQMVFELRPPAVHQLPRAPVLVIVGGGVGAVSAIIGIGGGTVTTPFLLWCNIAARRAIATSAACGLPIAVGGAAGYWFAGLDVIYLPAGSSGFLYWPAIIGVVASSVIFASLGARLTHRLPVGALKKGFAMLLVAVGLKLLVF